MKGIFYKCYKLKRLDLRNLNTSSAKTINGMFNDANSLVYINLFSFVIKRETDIVDLFKSTSSYLKICLNDSISQTYIKTRFSRVNFNCSDICFHENIKIDLGDDSCKKNCNESEYKYEYNNYCYQICPETTYVSKNNEYLCIDKIPGNNYYFDNDRKVYKECYKTCSICNKEGVEINNNCIE